MSEEQLVLDTCTAGVWLVTALSDIDMLCALACIFEVDADTLWSIALKICTPADRLAHAYASYDCLLLLADGSLNAAIHLLATRHTAFRQACRLAACLF